MLASHPKEFLSLYIGGEKQRERERDREKEREREREIDTDKQKREEKRESARQRESERKRRDMRDVNFPQEHVRKQLPVTFQWPWHKHKTRIVGLTGDAGSRDAGANCSAGPRCKRSGLLGQLTPVSAAGMCVCVVEAYQHGHQNLLTSHVFVNSLGPHVSAGLENATLIAAKPGAQTFTSKHQRDSVKIAACLSQSVGCVPQALFEAANLVLDDVWRGRTYTHNKQHEAQRRHMAHHSTPLHMSHNVQSA